MMKTIREKSVHLAVEGEVSAGSEEAASDIIGAIGLLCGRSFRSLYRVALGRTDRCFGDSDEAKECYDL